MSTPRRALIVIDKQNDYVGGRLSIEYPDVCVSLRNIGRAMDAATEAGIPVIVVQTVLSATASMMARGTPGAELDDVVRSRSRGESDSRMIANRARRDATEDAA